MIVPKDDEGMALNQVQAALVGRRIETVAEYHPGILLLMLDDGARIEFVSPNYDGRVVARTCHHGAEQDGLL